MNVNPEDIKSWSEAATAALAALKAAKDLLPAGKRKQDAEKAIEAAERDLQLAHASAAKELGFELCRRHWPPGIMVLSEKELYVCRECGRPHPSVTSSQSEHGMQADTVKVLKLYFDSDDKLSSSEIAAKFRFKESIAKYHLGVLVNKQLIWVAGMMEVEGYPVYYSITQEGRDFIVQHGMA